MHAPNWMLWTAARADISDSYCVRKTIFVFILLLWVTQNGNSVELRHLFELWPFHALIGHLAGTACICEWKQVIMIKFNHYLRSYYLMIVCAWCGNLQRNSNYRFKLEAGIADRGQYDCPPYTCAIFQTHCSAVSAIFLVYKIRSAVIEECWRRYSISPAIIISGTQKRFLYINLRYLVQLSFNLCRLSRGYAWITWFFERPRPLPSYPLQISWFMHTFNDEICHHQLRHGKSNNK